MINIKNNYWIEYLLFMLLDWTYGEILRGNNSPNCAEDDFKNFDSNWFLLFSLHVNIEQNFSGEAPHNFDVTLAWGLSGEWNTKWIGGQIKPHRRTAARTSTGASTVNLLGKSGENKHVQILEQKMIRTYGQIWRRNGKYNYMEQKLETNMW